MIAEKRIISSAEKTSNFTNMLTRVYKNKEMLAQFRFFSAPIDYVDLYIDKIWAVNSPIGIVYTEEETYLVVINVEEYTIVIGPVCEIQPSRRQINKITDRMQCTAEQKEDIYHKSKKISCMSVSTAVLMSCAEYHLLTGIKLNVSDILSYNERSDTNILRDRKKKKKPFYELEESIMVYESLYQFEKNIYQALRTGNTDVMVATLNSAPAILPQRGPTQLRHYRNSIIIAATYASRVIISFGVSPIDAISTADFYINMCEKEKKISEFPVILMTMMKNFTMLVRNSNHIAETSELIKKVNNYIEMHYTEKIIVDQMAEDFAMSRNSLSGKFKQETGLVLSEYIMMRKIERAKFIITNADQSLSEISEYLAFSSQSHFQRTFKKYTNMTPLEYKKKYG